MLSYVTPSSKSLWKGGFILTSNYLIYSFQEPLDINAGFFFLQLDTNLNLSRKKISMEELPSSDWLWACLQSIFSAQPAPPMLPQDRWVLGTALPCSQFQGSLTCTCPTGWLYCAAQEGTRPGGSLAASLGSLPLQWRSQARGAARACKVVMNGAILKRHLSPLPLTIQLLRYRSPTNWKSCTGERRRVQPMAG